MSASCPAGMSSEKSARENACAEPRHRPNHTANTYISPCVCSPNSSLKNPTHPHSGINDNNSRFSTSTLLLVHPYLRWNLNHAYPPPIAVNGTMMAMSARSNGSMHNSWYANITATVDMVLYPSEKMKNRMRK